MVDPDESQDFVALVYIDFSRDARSSLVVDVLHGKSDTYRSGLIPLQSRISTIAYDFQPVFHIEGLVFTLFRGY
jgi:hypothetical protein